MVRELHPEPDPEPIAPEVDRTRVRGLLRDVAGVPMGPATLVFYGGQGRSSVHAETSAAGEFLAALDPGTWSVYAQWGKEGYRNYITGFPPCEIPARPESSIDLEIPGGARVAALRGVVRGADGAALGKVQVHVRAIGAPFSTEATTREDGSFGPLQPLAGVYGVAVASASRESGHSHLQRVDLAPESQPVELSVNPGAVRGRALGLDRQPLAGVRVVPDFIEDGAGRPLVWGSRLSGLADGGTAADGSFHLGDLPAGRYRFILYRLPWGENGPWCRVGDVFVRPGETASDVELREVAPARLRGRILDSCDRVVEGAAVDSSDDQSTWIMGMYRSGPRGFTGPDGRFELPCMLPGRVTVWVEPPRQPGRSREHVVSFDLDLEPGADDERDLRLP